LLLSKRRLLLDHSTQPIKRFKTDSNDFINTSTLFEPSTLHSESKTKTIGKRGIKEGYYNSPKGDKEQVNFYDDAQPSPASSLTSPSTASVQSCEHVTELDLDSSGSPLEEEMTDCKEYLTSLREKKGIVCMDPLFEGEFLTFKCPRDHTFSTKRTEEIVCPKCQVIMEKCSEYAIIHKGKI
jgi:hypothetical protein